MGAVTFKRVRAGEFTVLLDGVETGHSIINGSAGVSGFGPNVYGVVKPAGGVYWIGTLQAAKKALAFSLTRRRA